MRDHRNRGGRFCNNNSTSIHTRFRHKIDKIMKTHAGPCESMWLHMRDHKDRGGRFCNYNSTSIHTRFRHKIDKIMKRWESSKSDPASLSNLTRHAFALALTQKMKKCEYCQSENAPKVSQKFACQPFFCKRQGRKPEMTAPVKSTPSLKKQIESLN